MSEEKMPVEKMRFQISGLKARHFKARAEGPGKCRAISLSPVRARQTSKDSTKHVASWTFDAPVSTDLHSEILFRNASSSLKK
jgi:hypothetical protein